MFFAMDVFYFFENVFKKNANSRHVDECHNKTKERDPLKEQVNWAQNSFFKGGLHE
jgi:hypothetical protein